MNTPFNHYLTESKERRQLIKQFDKKFFSYSSGNDIGLRAVARFFDGMAIFLMLIPYQEIKEDFSSFSLFIAILFTYGTIFYANSYLQFKDRNKMFSLLKRLHYIPVNALDYKIVRAEYLLRYKVKIFFIALVGQLAVTLIAYKTIEIMNFFYVILLAALFPFIIAIFQIGFEWEK